MKASAIEHPCRRSLRIAACRRNCAFHQNQADDEESCLCGLMSFNNSMHLDILTYEACMNCSIKWVRAKDSHDDKLRLVADNQGRGAFSIDVMKAVLEKKSFKLINFFKQNKMTLGDMKEDPLSKIVWNSRPCVIFTAQKHALAICDKGIYFVL